MARLPAHRRKKDPFARHVLGAYKPPANACECSHPATGDRGHEEERIRGQLVRTRCKVRICGCRIFRPKDGGGTERARCSVCLADFAVKKDGTLRAHLAALRTGSRQMCEGSSKPPAVMHSPYTADDVRQLAEPTARFVPDAAVVDWPRPVEDVPLPEEPR